MRINASGSFLSRLPMQNLLVVTRTLTASQINAMKVTPHEVIAAPGSGLVNIPLAMSIVVHTTGHTVWGGGGSTWLISGTGSHMCTIDGSLFTQTDDALSYADNGGLTNESLADYEDLPIKLSNSSADFTGGAGSTADVTIVYEQFRLS